MASIIGYRRVFDGGCKHCLIASQRLYFISTLMPLHENCNCGIRPVFEGEDHGLFHTRETLNVIEDSELGPRLDQTSPMPGNPTKSGAEDHLAEITGGEWGEDFGEMEPRKFIMPWGEAELTLDDSEGVLDLWNIEVQTKGKGTGTVVMEALKSYMDSVGGLLRLRLMKNPKFFENFEWLSEEPDHDDPSLVMLVYLAS